MKMIFSPKAKCAVILIATFGLSTSVFAQIAPRSNASKVSKIETSNETSQKPTKPLVNTLLNDYKKLSPEEQLQVEPAPIDFDTNRAWSGTRWYLIGKFQWPQRIDWLDGTSTPLTFTPASCGRFLVYEKALVRRSKQQALESSVAGRWVAVEVSPSSYSEELRVIFPKNSRCEAKATIDYIVNNKRGLRPFPLEKEDKNKIGPYEIRFKLLSDESTLGFTYKIATGIWRASFPNADGNPKASGILGPIGYGSIDWKYLPFYRRVGFTIEYSQNILGNIDGSDTQISDLNFYQWWEYLRLRRARHSQRIYLGVSTHYATDTAANPKISAENLRAIYPAFGLQFTQYIGSRSYLELRGIMGLSNEIGGLGVPQNYWAAGLEIGYYISTEAALLSSFERRNYLIKDQETESLNCFHAGVKLHF